MSLKYVMSMNPLRTTIPLPSKVEEKGSSVRSTVRVNMLSWMFFRFV